MKKFELKISEDDCDVAYLSLPGHPGRGVANVVARQIKISDVINEYLGPDIYFDFDKKGMLIGIEILA